MNKRDIENGAAATPKRAQGTARRTPTARHAPAVPTASIEPQMRADAIYALLRSIHDELRMMRKSVELMRDRQLMAASIGGIDSSRFCNAPAGLIDAAIEYAILAERKTGKALEGIRIGRAMDAAKKAAGV